MTTFIDYFTPDVLSKIDEAFTHVMLGSADYEFDHSFLLETYDLLDKNLSDWMIASSADEMHFLHIPPSHLERFFKLYFIVGSLDEEQTFDTAIVRLWAVVPHLTPYSSYVSMVDTLLVKNLPLLEAQHFHTIVSMMALITSVFIRDHDSVFFDHIERITQQLDERTRMLFIATLFQGLFAVNLNYKDYLSYVEQQVPPDYASAAIRRIESFYPNYGFYNFSEKIIDWNIIEKFDDPKWSYIAAMDDTVKYLMASHVAKTNDAWRLSESDMKDFFYRINMSNIVLIENFIERFGDEACVKTAKNGHALMFVPPATESITESPLHF